MENFYSKLHPLTIFITLMTELVYIVIAGYDIEIIPILVIVLLTELLLKGFSAFRKSLLLAMVICICFAAFNCIFYHAGERVFLYVNDIPLTIDSLIYGSFMGAMVATLFIWFKCFEAFLSNEKLIYLIGKPFPIVALIMSMIFCYYEKFRSKLDKINEAQLCYEVEQGVVRKIGRSFNVLLAVMLEDSITTAKSMRARAYGSVKRTSYEKYDFSVDDFAIVVVLIAFICLDIVLPISNLFRCAIFVTPVFYNLVKELQWKFYLSKI